MTPAEYLRIVVLPTLAELLAEPDDQRRAYLACITAAHLVDHVDRGARIGRKAVRAAAVGARPYATCCLEIVEGIANGTKHAGPSREAAFPFVPGYERYVPAFGLDELGAGLDEGRWNRAGLVVAHRIADGSEGLGSYFIDDCVCVVVRAYTSAFQALLGGVDIAIVAPELDRFGWLSAAIAAPFEDAP